MIAKASLNNTLLVNMKIKHLIGGSLYDGNCFFELCCINGRKINKASRQHTRAYGNFLAEAEELYKKLKNYINNKDVNYYPYYENDAEIKYMGFNDGYSECISIIPNGSDVIRDGQYLLIKDLWSDTAECGYKDYYCYDSIEVARQKGLAIIKDVFHDYLEKLPSDNELLRCLRKYDACSEEHYGCCIGVKIFKVVSLPKKSTKSDDIWRPTISLINAFKNRPL